MYARKFDAADEEAVKAVVREAVEKYGHLDGKDPILQARGWHAGLGLILSGFYYSILCKRRCNWREGQEN